MEGDVGMREAANILDIIRAKRRLSERDRAFLEAVADCMDGMADAKGRVHSTTVIDGFGKNLLRAVDAYITTKEDQ